MPMLMKQIGNCKNYGDDMVLRVDGNREIVVTSIDKDCNNYALMQSYYPIIAVAELDPDMEWESECSCGLTHRFIEMEGGDYDFDNFQKQEVENKLLFNSADTVDFYSCVSCKKRVIPEWEVNYPTNRRMEREDITVMAYSRDVFKVGETVNVYSLGELTVQSLSIEYGMGRGYVSHLILRQKLDSRLGLGFGVLANSI